MMMINVIITSCAVTVVTVCYYAVDTQSEIYADITQMNEDSPRVCCYSGMHIEEYTTPT